MPILMGLGLAAALLGYQAPRWGRARPGLSLLLAAVLPLAGLCLLYVLRLRPDDWEGMGAAAAVLLGTVWLLVTLVSGWISIRREEGR